MDRDRMLDMDLRLQPVRRRAFAVLAGALVMLGPWLGFWTLVPLAVASVLLTFADRRVGEKRRPEYVMFAAWVGAEVIIAISVALSGGPTVATMSWLAIPVVTLASRFSDRGIVAGILIVIGLLLAVALGVDPHAVIANPPVLVAPAVLVVTVAMFSIALMQSDVEHRSRAVVDELTGMLNRTALVSRVEELEQQSLVTRLSVGVVIADIDRFKAINDTHGHTTGDAVLQDVAYIMRKQLRAFDLAYRMGGEEFLVLLPGAERAQAATVAELLRRAVEAEPLGGGIDVTISCGVADSAADSAFSYETVFAEADAALYEAKRTGRNRVCEAGARAAAAPDDVVALGA
jgi:diguanylate cyclase (GGDEF)-like protein